MVEAVYKLTEVGVIPEDWQVGKIEEVAQLSSGTTPSRQQEDRYFTNGEFNWVKTTDLNNSTITKTEEKVTQLALNETVLQIYKPGTVLVAMYGGFNQIGRTGLLNIPASVNQALVAIKPRFNKLDSVYLLAQLNYRVKYWKNVASSSRKDPNITSKDVREFVLPLPPIQEQQAIAESLSDVDALIAGLDKLIAKKRAIKTATMQVLLTGEMRLPGFGDNRPHKQTEIGLIPEDWELMKLVELAEIATGNTPSTKRLDYYGGEYLFASPADMGNQKYITKTEKMLSKAGFSVSRRFPPHSVLFTCIGSTIGKCGIAVEELTSNQQINAVFPSKKINNEYLYYQLKRIAPKIKALAGEQAVPIVNKSQFGESLILIPLMPEQQAIAEVLSDMDAEITALETRRAKTQVIKRGMMQELLTGRTRLL